MRSLTYCTKLLIVSLGGVEVALLHGIGKPLGREHADGGTTREEGCDEVGRWAQGELKVGMFIRRVQFALAMVQGKVAQVVGLAAIGTDEDLLDGDMMVVDDAVAIAEPVGGYEAGVVLEGGGGELKREDAVEGEGEESAIFRVAHQGIPSLVEEFDEVGLDEHQ